MVGGAKKVSNGLQRIGSLASNAYIHRIIRVPHSNPNLTFGNAETKFVGKNKGMAWTILLGLRGVIVPEAYTVVYHCSGLDMKNFSRDFPR